MKFMKLGAKADIFHTEGNVTSVATDLSSDVVIKADGAQFHLHKFPLLCKSGRLQKLIAEAREMSKNEIELDDFPGGFGSLELCMKFCYGIAITFNAYNVVSVRCGAEYLEMTEAMEKGNLVYKLEVFLNTSIFRSWKDSIIVLQTCKGLMPWSEDLKIIGRCIDSIASKTATDPVKVDWSFTHTRTPTAAVSSIEHSTTDLTSPPWNGIQSRRNRVVPKDWWAEDILELEMDFYWRVMVAIKAKGMAQNLVGEALRLYALRWLPGLSKDEGGSRTSTAVVPCEAIEVAGKSRLLLETIVNLLPADKGTCCCSFLLKLLKAATILNASPSCKMELARRIGLQLDEATLDDLLIPSLSYSSDSLYDVDVIQHILEHFLMQDQSPTVSPTRGRAPGESRRRTRSAENIDFSESRRATCATHSSKLKVAKLIDSYLAEIARDPNIPVSKFVSLAEAIPDFSRPAHDGLYRGIDMYLKEHPNLSKSDRKRLCRLMDCKKLSMDACMHAAQNERLPLRVVVQVLFFEQVRTAMTGGILLHDLPRIKALLPPSQVQALEAASLQDAGTPEEAWDTVHHDFNTLKGDLADMKKRIAEAERERTTIIQLEAAKQSSKQKTNFPFPSISKKFLGKFFNQQSKGPVEATKGSDTSTKDSESSGSGNAPTGKATVRTQNLAVT